MNNFSHSDRLTAREAHARSLGMSMWDMGDHAMRRNKYSHHGRQVTPRRRAIVRRAERLVKAGMI